jgi:hypothetical protein
MNAAEAEIVCSTAAAGFRDLADRAAVFRDQLCAVRAPQDVIARVDRILFAAQVGENNAVATPRSEPVSP